MTEPKRCETCGSGARILRSLPLDYMHSDPCTDAFHDTPASEPTNELGEPTKYDYEGAMTLEDRRKWPHLAEVEDLYPTGPARYVPASEPPPTTVRWDPVGKDVEDDCIAEFGPLSLRCEAMDDGVFWWAVYRSKVTPPSFEAGMYEEVVSSNDGRSYPTMQAARAACMDAAAKLLTSGDTVPETPTGASCYDCGRLYGEDGFHDLVVPDDIWSRISPTGDEGGLLCPKCMLVRCEKLGIECPAAFTSGPFTSQPPWRKPPLETPTGAASEGR